MTIINLEALERLNKEIGAPPGSDKAKMLENVKPVEYEPRAKKRGKSSKTQRILRREIVEHMLALDLPEDLIVEKIALDPEYEPYRRGLERPRQAVRKDLEAHYKKAHKAKVKNPEHIALEYLARLKAQYTLAMRGFSNADSDKVRHDFLARASDISKKILEGELTYAREFEQSRYSVRELPNGEDPDMIDGDFIQRPELKEPDLQVPDDLKEEDDDKIVIPSEVD